MRYLVIINPTAGGGMAEDISKRIKAFFTSHGHRITLLPTRKEGDAIRRVKQHKKRHDCIVACGGDGTINEVVNGIMGSKKTLGIIPLGTENVIAQYLKLPASIEEACSRIIAGRPRRIDMGKANGRYFIMCAGIGFDAHVASKVEPLLKKIMGSIAYPITAIKEIFSYTPAKITVSIGRRKYAGYYVIVSNCRYYGGKIPLAYRAEIDDGLLDVCIFRNPQIYNALRYLASATILEKDYFKDAFYIKTKKLRITAEKPTLVHTDCEVIGTTPINIGVKKQALRVIG